MNLSHGWRKLSPLALVIMDSTTDAASHRLLAEDEYWVEAGSVPGTSRVLVRGQQPKTS